MAQVRSETPIAPDLAAAASALGLDISQLAAAGSGAAAVPQAYFGTTTTPYRFSTRAVANEQVGRTSGRRTIAGTQTSKNLIPIDRAQSLIWDWRKNDPAKFNGIVQKMISAGIVGDDWTMFQVESAWGKAVAFSAENQMVGFDLTPEEVFDAYAEAYGPGGPGSRGRSGSRSGSGSSSRQTQTSTSVDLSNAETARAILNKAASDALGRIATADEIKQFHSALNAKEQANPTKTTSTVTVNGSNVSSSSTSSGGFDGTAKMQLGEDTAQANPEWAEYQAATTYFDAMMGALASPTGG